MLQDKVVKRRMLKPKKQYSLAVENPETLYQQPVKRRHLNETQSQPSTQSTSLNNA